MAETSLEQLQKMIQRLLDKDEIHRIMCMHEWYHNALMYREELEDIWALEMPDVSFATNTAVFEGKKDLWKFYVDHSEEMKKDNNGAGNLWHHCLANEIIEVAEDGKTAKGVWMSSGQATVRIGDNKPRASWAYEKYGVDFVKVDGKWKIWHFHAYTDFYSPFDKCWTDITREMPPVEKLFKVTRVVRSYKEYTPTTVPQFIPKPPEPYKTFDAKKA
jgi:hypothetical protein